MVFGTHSTESSILVVLVHDTIVYLFSFCTKALAGFFTYFIIMGESGFLPLSLIWLREQWDDENTFITDSYGQEWVGARF